MCDDKLDALVIEGNPPLYEIQEAWINIWYQYIDKSADSDTRYITKLQKEITGFKAKSLQTVACVDYLRSFYDEDLVAVLRRLQFNFKYDPDSDHYDRDLDGTIQQSKLWELQVKLKQAELEAYEQREKGEKPSREYFDIILVRMSKWCGYHIDEEKITVSRFAAMKSDYVHEIEYMKKQSKK